MVKRVRKKKDNKNAKLREIPIPLSEDSEFQNSFTDFLATNNIQITGPNITNILASATTGYSQQQANLFESVIEKEPIISTHLQTRRLTLLGLNWNITGGSSAQNREMERILEEANIYELMEHLLDAVPKGYAGSFIEWENAGASIKKFKHIHSTRIEFDENSNPFILTKTGQRTPMNNFGSAQIILHYHKMFSGIPSKTSLMRSLVWMFFFKHNALKHRARYIEKFGIPFLLAKVSSSDFANAGTRSAIKKAIKNIGADGSGVVTANTDLTSIDVKTPSNVNFQEWINYIDKTYTLMILGQEASSGDSSGMSNGTAQDKVRQDLLAGDCVSLMNTINRNIIRPLEYFKYGTEEMKFVLDYMPTVDIAPKIDALTKFNDMLKGTGKKIDLSYIESEFNIPLVDINNEEELKQQLKTGTPTESNGDAVNIGEENGGVDMLKSLGLNDLRKTINKFYTKG